MQSKLQIGFAVQALKNFMQTVSVLMKSEQSEHVLTCLYDHVPCCERILCGFCRSHHLLRVALLSLAAHVHASKMAAVWAQLNRWHRFRGRLRQGRLQRAFCAWAFVSCVLHWRTLRVKMRTWAAWKHRVHSRRQQEQCAAAHRCATLRSRAWSAWHAEHMQVRLLFQKCGIAGNVVCAASSCLAVSTCKGVT